MIKLNENGNVLWPHEYCIINNIEPITEEDCYQYIKGDTLSIISYFFNNFNKTNLVFPNNNKDFQVWRSFCYSEDEKIQIIKTNDLLQKINKILKISKLMIMEISANSFVAWHHDYPVKGPVLNLLLTPEHRSYSLFTYNIPNTVNLIECKYKPNQFCLYNTDIIHSILNFEKPRYIFSVIFEKGESQELNWKNAKDILKEFIC